jgi:hypothetical protein
MRRKNETHKEKPLPALLWPPQVPHLLTSEITCVRVVTGRRIKASAIASIPISNNTVSKSLCCWHKTDIFVPLLFQNPFVQYIVGGRNLEAYSWLESEGERKFAKGKKVLAKFLLISRNRRYFVPDPMFSDKVLFTTCDKTRTNYTSCYCDCPVRKKVTTTKLLYFQVQYKRIAHYIYSPCSSNILPLTSQSVDY